MDNQIIAQHLFTDKIQTTAPYTCPICGAAITKILHYPDWTSPRATPKPLDNLGQHLDYLLCDDCDGCHRVARLGDIILPFGWPPQCTAADELQVITAALTAILAQIVRRWPASLAQGIEISQVEFAKLWDKLG